MMLTNRAELEQAFAQALSRHIGHTTGAYDLERILSILPVFQTRPSVYREEIVASLREGADPGARQLTQQYLEEVITFAAAFGLIHQTSSREATLANYALTERGRSLLAARQLKDSDFSRFYVARLVFLADADAVMAVLMYCKSEPRARLEEFYADYFLKLRHDRLQWLQSAFNEPILFARIANRLLWLKRAKATPQVRNVERITLNTARHHSLPRKGWLQSLDLLRHDGLTLTAFGEEALASLAGDGRYFWLGPPNGTQEQLGVPPSMLRAEPAEDQFCFRSSLSPASQEQQEALALDVADIMKEGYQYARLIHASQASLLLPAEYVIYRSFKDRLDYDALIVLDIVFRLFKSEIDRLSALKGRLGFYRVRPLRGGNGER